MIFKSIFMIIYFNQRFKNYNNDNIILEYNRIRMVDYFLEIYIFHHTLQLSLNKVISKDLFLLQKNMKMDLNLL